MREKEKYGTPEVSSSRLSHVYIAQFTRSTNSVYRSDQTNDNRHVTWKTGKPIPRGSEVSTVGHQADLFSTHYLAVSTPSLEDRHH